MVMYGNPVKRVQFKEESGSGVGGVCEVCVVGGWFKQPHLAPVRLISLALGEAAHL